MLVGPVVSCIRSQGDGVPMMEPHQLGPPPAQGLYDPRHEHDACGVGFVVDIKGRKSHAIVRQALKVLINLLHRGACGCEPFMRQMFIGRGPGVRDHAHFERKLYVIRKRIENAVDAMDFTEKKLVYVPSLSSNTLIYKGMLSADQIEGMFPDLTDPDVESALALVHQRFSTNTFPSWPLAHPYRFVAHNGEINTLRGNINWMRAREALCRSDVLGEDLAKVFPVTREGLSDSATFDNVLEFLVMSGRSLPHAILMMIPEPWQNHESMSPERRAFYEYHASLMEPWDGPASIAFTHGPVIGAVLDRNGLRPSRYYVTRDDLVVMASEVGLLDLHPEN